MLPNRAGRERLARCVLAPLDAGLEPLDIAARIVPLRVAAMLFALLMALSNFASTTGEGLGGHLYEWLRDEFGSMTAFRTMLLLGIVILSTCWIAVPRLRRDVPQWWD